VSVARTWPVLRLDLSRPLTDADRDRLLMDVDDTASIGLEEDADGVSLYFLQPAERDAARESLARAGWATHATLTVLDVPDDGWAGRSQADLPAIRVDRIVVSPPWDVARVRAEVESVPDAERPDVIEIEPSTGFGTGHHQSTRLCLRALQHIDVAGLDVLDLGTGSGVLAIAAVRRGARAALGIDPDQDAIDAATDSVARNAATAVTLRTTGLDDPTLAPAPLVFANLTGVLLRREATRIQALMAPAGRAILSGFTDEEAPWVQQAFDGCDLVARFDEESWVAFLLRRRG
jgi:ribosomal protein L11 methyltransferase